MAAAEPFQPTPDISHLSGQDYERVYEPAEDTFLLMDALEADKKAGRMEDLAANPLCVEVGSGSGTVITFLAQLLGSEGSYFATDVNEDAVLATRRTAERNGVVVRAVRTDLVEAIAESTAGRVDILLFNPPYVVTPPEEVGGAGISAAWAGGEHGREVTDRLLPVVADLLAPKGRFYLLALKENMLTGAPGDLEKAMPGFACRTVVERRAGAERLRVLCFSR